MEKGSPHNKIKTHTYVSRVCIQVKYTAGTTWSLTNAHFQQGTHHLNFIPSRITTQTSFCRSILPLLDIIKIVSEMSYNHFWRLDTLDKPWRSPLRRVNVGRLYIVDARGDQVDQAVDEFRCNLASYISKQTKPRFMSQHILQEHPYRDNTSSDLMCRNTAVL